MARVYDRKFALTQLIESLKDDSDKQIEEDNTHKNLIANHEGIAKTITTAI